MSKNDPTPPRSLHTPQNPPRLPTEDDPSSDDEDAPDLWSEELFPLNIIPFSDNDNYDEDPDYYTPPTSSGEEDDEEDEEEEEEDDINMNQQGQAAQAQAAQAQPAPPPPPTISGGQLSSVPVFTGNQGLDGLVYVEAIDRAKDQFGWTQIQTARAAVTRGGNAVANWIRGEKAAGVNFTAWNENNMVNMRSAFLTRFGPKYTTGGAVAAIADLKQRSGETVGGFLDRVKIAVDMLHYNVEEANRNQAFRDGYTRLVIAQFGSGVNDDIRQQIFGVPNPPETIAAVLAAATAVENEKHSKATKLVINPIEEEQPQEDKDTKKEQKTDSTDIEKECEMLKKQMKEILAIGKGSYRGRGRGGAANNGKCYGCGQPGHIRANCPSPQQQPYQYYRGRGNGWRGRGRGRGRPYQTRRGRYASNFGASRGRPAQFPIGDLTGHYEEDYDEEWNYEDEHDGYHDGYEYEDYQGSGNDPWGRY